VFWEYTQNLLLVVVVVVVVLLLLLLLLVVLVLLVVVLLVLLLFVYQLKSSAWHSQNRPQGNTDPRGRLALCDSTLTTGRQVKFTRIPVFLFVTGWVRIESTDAVVALTSSRSAEESRNVGGDPPKVRT
jgi:Ca2+/Na+ antiporter